MNTETEGGSADDTPSGDDAAGASPQAAVNLKISTVNDLVTLSATKASDYQNETIIITASGGVINVTGTAFTGLGSADFPFAGKIEYVGGSEAYPIVLNRALFNALSASAAIANVNLTWAGTKAETENDAAVLADTVYPGTNAATWTVNLGAYSGDTSSNEYRLPALIHTIRNGATVTLSAVNNSAFPFAGQGFFCDNLDGTLIAAYPEKLPTFNTAKNHVGGLVGTMAAGAALTVNAGTTAIVIDVATNGSTAGGLVGKMENGATLTVNAKSITVKQVTAAATDGSNVGTLVGEATNPIVTKLPVEIAAAAGHQGLTGYNVGGLVGKMTLDGQSVQPPIADVTGLILKGTNCGGLYGVLSSSVSFAVPAIQTFGYFDDGEFKPKITTSVTATHLSSGAGDAGSAGGVIGLYCPTSTDTAPVTLQFTDASTNVTVNKDNNKFANVGGMIGSVQPTAGSKKSYVSLSGVSSLTQNDIPALHIGGFVGSLESAPVHLLVNGRVVSARLDSETTGGLLGLADDNGHLVETSNDLTIAVANLTGTIAGGLVGKMDSGVLYLHNVPTLNITNIPSGASHGWIVGNRGNALVCSKEVWNPIATSNPEKELNDTGIWGQVLQLSQFDPDLVTLDSEHHSVSIRALPAKDGNYYAIGSLTDFASVALRLQLSPVGMLTIDSDIPEGAVKLKLNTNIDLTGTGLTGLTRDNSVGNYGFDIQGNGKTITLPNVTIFAGNKSHIFQGLIGQCRSGLTLNNLTVAGGSDIFCPNGQSTSVHCGIVGETLCPATFTDTTSTVSWNLGGWALNSALSGFIGIVSYNHAINFTNCSWSGKLEDVSGTNNGVCRLGGFIGTSNNNTNPSITVTSCTIGGTVRNTVSKDYGAAMGGLFGCLRYCGMLAINGLTVSTTMESTSKQSSGGLLGYELYVQDKATFSGITIENSTLTTNAKFGGLIYKGAGYWQVINNGIQFKSATISGISDNTTPSGLLVSVGCSGVESYGGLYLEVGYNAYKIDPGVTVTLTSGTYFDELVGRSIQEVGSGKNGVVSIATKNNALIDTDGCNTYQKQLSIDYNNPCTRYYYNLDKFRTEGLPGDTISTPAQMALWSAYNECRNCTTDGTNKSTNSNLGRYFASGSSKRTVTGNIDLVGYSFYPVAFDGTSIQNANITFGFQRLEETERNTDNKKPSDTLRQHAGMHTGIFTGITTHSSVLTVNNLTLTGTVGGLNGEYGTLVRGNVEGRLNTGDIKDVKDTVLNITGVTLDGIRVYPDLTNDTGTVAPLLIFRIGSYVTLRLTDVVTTSGYAGISKAASSLIGTVGSSGNTTSIDLEFSKIQLTPPSSEADTDCKQRNCTLFTRALFLESFQYASSCRGVYNFKRSDNYTIGQEVSNTTTGRNLEKQYWFFDEWGSPAGYVCGENNNPADSYKDYTRYVYQAEKTGAENYKELDVNLQPLDLTDGCGTYSDPYRITSGGVLQELAKALSGAGSNPSWKVNISTEVLPNSSISPSFSNDDGHTHEAAADGRELVLVCGEKGNDWSIAANDTDSGNDATTVRATEAQMLTYLRNAYYMVTEDITLPSDWAGLGTAANPFRGVIVGGGSPAPTVAITTTSSAKQFGGLIRFSEGSVVKNLSIHYPASFTLTSDSNNILNYDSAVFFGGVVGCCKAGDTVIDGVSVTLPTQFTCNNAYAAIGGYVGLVGGANSQGGGGVVFRGSASSSWQPNGNLYTNPYVGRVLDGYAISETNKLDNSDKNYTIHTLPTLSSHSLTLTADTVTVGNADGLWLLSAMENSRHGEVNGNGAYVSGKPRTDAYNTIGQSTQGGVSDESGSGTQTSYYLWKHYGITTPLPTAFKLEFIGDCNMTAFGNGFRGIGVSQGTFRYYLKESAGFPRITEINGNGRTVTLNQNRQEPTGQHVDWAAMGAGLFPVLNAGPALSVHNLTLTGSVNLTVGDTVNGKTDNVTFHPGYQRTQIGAGMLAGALVSRQANSSVSITNVNASGTVTTNSLMAGGLIGYCGSPVTRITNPGAVDAFSKLASINVTNCSVNATVKGSSSVGGFIGFAYANTVTAEKCSSNGISIGVTGYRNNGKLWNYGNNSGFSDGLGGIIGTAFQTALHISDITLNGVTILADNGSDGTKDIGFGGIAGSVSTTAGSSNWLTGITMNGMISIQDTKNGHVSAGFLIGYLADTNVNGWKIDDGGASSFEISNVKIGCNADSTVALKGFQVGGLIGMLKDGKVALKIGGEAVNSDGTKTPLPVCIGNAESKNGKISANSYSDAYNRTSISGLIGIVCNMPTIDIQNLYLSGIGVDRAIFNSLILAKSAKANATITLKDAEIVSCSLTKNGDNETGFLLGSSNGDKTIYNGFNILLKNCKTDASGIFAGTIAETGSSMNLVAVSVVGDTGGTTDFFSGNGYVIRSDYTGAQTYQRTSSKPWVDVNPLSTLNDKVSGVSPVTGDGTAFMVDGKKPIGTQIAQEGKYYNVASAANYFMDSDKASSLGISLAPFSTAGGNTGTNMPDFPVLVLPAVSKTEVNTAVYNYISLLTNFNSSAETLSGKLEGAITATTYQWKDMHFEAITDSSINSSITVDNSTIYTTPGKYDNTLNQFTLLTVSYQDPTYAGNSYKLYIPIVVQKLLNYHFYASAISGTLYNRKPYETVDSLVVTTHGDQVTVLLSYVYDNGKTGSPAIAEWQNSIDNGDNLLWNFDKKIVVARDGNNDLPTGTKLTLVDRNNRDRAYYATYDGSGIIPLNSFKDAAEQPYEKNALCDAMGLEAKKDDNGLFVTTDKATATVRVGETYYRPAADSDTDTRYSITVGNAALLEEYYLTIQTPANSEELSNVKIQCEASLKNETGDKTTLPNKFIEADSQHPYTRNNAENRILFGNFFQQTVTVTTDTAEEISDANNTINATLTVAINYKSDAWKERFAPYAKSIQLYQRFELQATDWTGGTSASTSFTDRTATIRYLNGTTPVGSAKATELGAEGIMVLKFPESVTVSTNTELNAATLVAEVSLAYTSDQIQAQFHTRSNNTDGLQLWANSHLAFSDAALERSNNPTSGYDAGRFYRTESTPATLVYNANGTDVDARVNQLGVNGRVQDAASIDSVATYNVSVLDAAKSADTILYSIELYAKDADGKFTQKIEDYSELLKVGNITATLADRNGTEKRVNFGETFTGGIDPSIPIRISLPLTVVTGNGFTGPYANYKVNLRVWLQNGNAQITGSEATDYIIYTNAKIKFPVVTSN